ncbi:iron ABC transporter permease [Staphylococcus simiae]|uniref:FecCD family ABC transporter permease n=1 Tax=Staphylococcus simiae TaxID=308354 RepID=UPI001A96CE2A|nr:iron ABC transporter permease [Staphylococcus simiae]MBO1198026.1 iron ABC transporter permease [Staphylococcus simiae]MBO1200224.1 iron ABC transporter permease [Staphylococcus simiae]MBO1202497.1 iron ABC transporter permease [Staphylococcus simiae]MBO1210109.1 iron ABC transporter permease [Staphylococcus simiae]MBO1228641.1 iron ABC transporter permease [Staphylococcus simiae]
MANKTCIGHTTDKEQTRKHTSLIFIVSVCLLVVFMYLNTVVGSAIKFKDITHFLSGHVDSDTILLLRDVRLPRMVAAIVIGGAFAVSGLLMQAMTRNPLASPKIFGVTSGASFVIVLITVLLPSLSYFSTLLAMIGAFLGGLTVYILSGSTKGITPVKIALAGMSVHLFYMSMTEGIIILNENSNQEVMFWLVGSLASMQWNQVLQVLPVIMIATILALIIGRQLSILELGDDIARSLGQHTNRIRLLIGLIVIMLTGSSVAIAGPIGFIGLIIPHIVKGYVSHNYAIMVPLTFILGANLLLISDVLSRLITYPYESPVGIVTSFVGAMYFLILTIRGVKQL